jgi:hypothetical protein
VVDDPRADLDQLFAQTRERPLLNRFGCRKRAQEIADVRHGVKLQANGVGVEGATGEPRPLDGALSFFDPLFSRPALVVEPTAPSSLLLARAIVCVPEGNLPRTPNNPRGSIYGRR